MTRRDFDVVVVGGGLAGCAVARECGLLGLRTLLLERHAIGSAGATRFSGGIVRVTEEDPLLAGWAAAGAKHWNSWSLSGLSPFHRTGFYYLLDAASEEWARNTASRHHCDEYPMRLVSVEDCRRLQPALRFDAGAGSPDAPTAAIFEPNGGYVDTRLAARLLAEGARARGAVIWENCPVRAVHPDGDEAVVELAGSAVRARAAVIAAGVGSRSLLGDAGIVARSIPLSCFRQSLANVQVCAFDARTGAYHRPGAGGLSMIGGGRQVDFDPDGEVPQVSDGIQATHRRAMRTFCGEPGSPVSTLAGYDAYTPDKRPLLGARSPCVHVATAFSGRGAKYIPIVAREVARGVAQSIGRA
jgi:glycine/D-amino acid oxidase-like deaminating enzyme